MTYTRSLMVVKPAPKKQPLREIDGTLLDAVVGGNGVPPFGGGTGRGSGAGGSWITNGVLENG